jgi:hypothetical protein
MRYPMWGPVIEQVQKPKSYLHGRRVPQGVCRLRDGSSAIITIREVVSTVSQLSTLKAIPVSSHGNTSRKRLALVPSTTRPVVELAYPPDVGVSVRKTRSDDQTENESDVVFLSEKVLRQESSV